MAKRQNWSSRRRKSARLAQLPTRGARGNIPFARGAVAWVLGDGEILLRGFKLSKWGMDFGGEIFAIHL